MSEHLHRVSFLWRYAARWKWRIFLALCSLSVVSVTTLVYPWLLKLMVDHFAGNEQPDVDVTWLGGILVLLFACSTLLGYHHQLTMHSLGYQLRNTLRLDLYNSLLHRSMSFHRNQQVGELSARATEDIGKLQPIFGGLISPVFQNLLIIGGGLLLSTFLNWGASLVLVFFMLAPIPFVLRYSKRIRALGAKSQSEHARANAHLEETLVAIREVKAFGRETLEISRYGSFLSSAFRNEMRASRMVIRGNQFAYLLLSLMLLALFYLAASGLIPNWTAGSMVAFYFYAYTMATALLSIGRIYLTYQSVTGALDRVVDLVSTGPQGDSDGGSYAATLLGKVEFRNVSFGYLEDQTVLLNASLVLERGEWIVIGGPSGSGKSTFASLLMGFYEPARGTITIDGHPISEWRRPDLRRQIGYVGQDPLLFHGSLRENVLFAGIQATETELKLALEIACLTDVVASLPNGVDTIVGERGFTLSGGQKARVAIARAIILNPPLLILDEPNSMLEKDLEAKLWQNLSRERQGKTTIILTHHTTNIPPVYTHFILERGVLTTARRHPAGSSSLTNQEIS